MIQMNHCLRIENIKKVLEAVLAWSDATEQAQF